MLEDTTIENFEIMEAYFLAAMTWSLGGGLLEEGRVKLDNYIKYLASLRPKDSDKELAGPGILLTMLQLFVILV